MPKGGEAAVVQIPSQEGRMQRPRHQQRRQPGKTLGMRPITLPPRKPRRPTAWSVGSLPGVGPTAAAGGSASRARKWRARAHGIWEREASEETNVSERGPRPQGEEEGAQDKFMAAFSGLLDSEPPPPERGIVWTTSEGWQVWEATSASTHRGMAAAAVSKASWCSGLVEPVV